MARRTDESKFHPHQRGASGSAHLLAAEKEWRSRLGERQCLLALATFLDTTRLLGAAEAQAFLSVRALQH
jgi:hypothetical protein